MTVVLPVPPMPGPAPVTPALAGWWRRAAAVLLDDLVLAAVTWAGYGGGSPAVSLHPPSGFTAGAPRVGDPAPWAAAAVGAALLVLLLLQAYTGATPGKRVAGVAVVRADTGGPAGFLRTLARPFVNVVDSILLIGYLRPLWHPLRRTVADSALGTVAVVTRGPRWLPGWCPVPPRPSRASAAVTAAAVAVCVVGAVFAVPTATSGSVTTVGDPVACDVRVPAGVPDVGAAATLQRTGVESAERRAWVVRDLAPSGPGFDVAWSWTGSLGVGDVRVEARVSRAGDPGEEPTLITEQPRSAGPGAGAASLAAGPDGFTGLTPAGWVETSLVVDGRAVAACRVPGARLLDA
ncbi:RDD family protein [Cellulomonas sp. GbtcB1]|uniref:RDD family protein n=1 Tax=Cellulomonas sp. GbtcB1 TaxID=2824746 RepID=UPI001C2FFF69|nr:RDD family protein [Cellulomonas sp. GbtcB1]